MELIMSTMLFMTAEVENGFLQMLHGVAITYIRENGSTMVIPIVILI